MKPLDKIDFSCESNQEISATFFDTIGNSYKRRFLLNNFHINVKLNFNKINKMKEKSSYKISIIPKDIIMQKNKAALLTKKVELNDFNKMANLTKEIDNYIKKDREKIDYDEMRIINKELKSYDD